jgi:uncharacterized phiE125 gp8 family phage protein
MIYTRTPIVTDPAITLAEAKAHLRVTSSAEDTLIGGMIEAAAQEIEAQTDIALLTQTITTITEGHPAPITCLPVGPVALDAVATVTLIEDDGTLSPITAGFFLEGGRYPRLHFLGGIEGRLCISYTAGHSTVPADLRLGIADQVARLYTERGGVMDKGPSLSPHTARIIARHRRVTL